MDLRETRARKRLDLLGYRHEEYDSNTPLEALESFLYKLDESVRENPSDVGKPYGPVARLECLHRMAEAGISTTAIIVWNTIAGYTNSKQQDGICFPGIDTIARGSGQSPATVKRCIKMLVDLNVLEKLSIGRGRGVSNKYRVVPDWRPTLGLSLNLEKKSGENTSSYDKQLNDEPISPKGKQHPNDPLISKKGSCEPEKQLKVEQKTAQTRATNSLSNPGLNPGKIERQADTSGLPVARAPSGRCSPPGEQRLDELIARLSEGMKDQQKKAIDKYRKRNIQNGHSHAAMTDGIERNLAYAKAWGKEPWNLVAMIRDQKYFDPWDTRPPKKKQKNQKTKAKKYGNERNTRARTTAAAKPNNKDRDLRKPITTNRQPPEPT
ncbi:MAG: helix-turn-helix domain-containing protein, partial [Lacipirellulaceae bacterium]